MLSSSFSRFSRFDPATRKHIKNNLNRPGWTSADLDEFIRELEHSIRSLGKYPDRIRTDTVQYKIFSDIGKSIAGVLRTLNGVRRNEHGICADVHTATLLHTACLKEVIARHGVISPAPPLMQDDALIGVLDFDSPVICDYRYPTQLLLGLECLQQVVASAANSVKPRKGNSPTATTPKIQKRLLANAFVFAHKKHFGTYPKLSRGGTSNVIFNEILHSFMPHEPDGYLCLRNAVNRDKKIVAFQRTNDQLRRKGLVTLDWTETSGRYG